MHAFEAPLKKWMRCQIPCLPSLFLKSRPSSPCTFGRALLLVRIKSHPIIQKAERQPHEKQPPTKKHIAPKHTEQTSPLPSPSPQKETPFTNSDFSPCLPPVSPFKEPSLHLSIDPTASALPNQSTRTVLSVARRCCRPSVARRPLPLVSPRTSMKTWWPPSRSYASTRWFGSPRSAARPRGRRARPRGGVDRSGSEWNSVRGSVRCFLFWFF